MAVPGVEHQADRLLDDVAPAVEVAPQPDEFVRPVARADAQPHAAVRQDVHERCVLDHADRVVQRQCDDRRTDVDPAGLGREVGHVGEAVRHDAVAGGEVVLGDPGGVVAQPLGLDDLGGRAGVHIAMRIGLFLRVRMGCEKDAEFHVSSPFVGDPRGPAMHWPAIEVAREGTYPRRANGGLTWHSTSSSGTA
jgi:hypothetical protein